MAEQPIKRTTEQVRGGESRGHMRWVLIIGTLLAVGALAWLALGTDVVSQAGDVSGPAPAAVTE